MTRITSAQVKDMWKSIRVKARQLSDRRDALARHPFFSAENAAAFYTFCAQKMQRDYLLNASAINRIFHCAA